MKAVILAGGFGTRIAEETGVRPKPMVEVGGQPILWHIMKIYSAHGIQDFVVCTGYRGEVIRDYFANYALNASNVTFDLARATMEVHSSVAEPWRVTVVDTGLDALTGGRLLRAREHIGDETFCMTYGDCVSDVDLTKVIEHHRRTGALVTLTAIQPPGRFGALTLSDDSRIEWFHEKHDNESAWVNGGFFVIEPEALDFVTGDRVSWEREPLQAIARAGRLHAFRYSGYWQNLDTLRDKMVLEEEWAGGSPRWRIW